MRTFRPFVTVINLFDVFGSNECRRMNTKVRNFVILSIRLGKLVMNLFVRKNAGDIGPLPFGSFNWKCANQNKYLCWSSASWDSPLLKMPLHFGCINDYLLILILLH